MKKTFSFWLCFVGAIVFATYFCVRIIMGILGTGNIGVIKSVSISSDSDRRHLGAVAAAVGIPTGTGTYSVNLDDIAARISSVSNVRNWAVRRLANGNIAVRVKLHKMSAVLYDDGNFFPISADGTVIGAALDARPENMPVFRGRLPKNISDIANLLRPLSSRAEYAQWIENRRWDIKTTNDITIMLPEENPAAAVASLMTMDRNNNILSKNIRVLDMRDPARVLIK